MRRIKNLEIKIEERGLNNNERTHLDDVNMELVTLLVCEGTY